MKKIMMLLYRFGFPILNIKIGKYYPVKKTYNFLVKPFKKDMVYIDTHKIYLDKIDSMSISLLKGIDPMETKIIKEKLKPGQIAIDIGANIGVLTLLMAKIVGEKGKVYAFEPDPYNFSILKKNIEVNGYKNVILENKAISNNNINLNLYLCKDNYSDHRTYNSNDGRKCINVNTTSLDNYFLGKNVNDIFIKMDIQGAEYNAILGMKNLINEGKISKIVMEYWPIGLYRSNIKPSNIIDLLQKHKFKLFNIDEQKEKVYLIDDIFFLKYTVKNEKFTNILCEL